MDRTKRMAELTQGIETIKSEQLKYVQCKTIRSRQLVAEEIVSILIESVMRNSDLIEEQSSIDSFSRALEVWQSIIKNLERQKN